MNKNPRTAFTSGAGICFYGNISMQNYVFSWVSRHIAGLKVCSAEAEDVSTVS